MVILKIVIISIYWGIFIFQHRNTVYIASLNSKNTISGGLCRYYLGLWLLLHTQKEWEQKRDILKFHNYSQHVNLKAAMKLI